MDRKRRLTNSTEILQELFENGSNVLSEQFLRWKIWKRWSEYVGQSIAAVSEPVSFRRGVLYVWVKNSSWQQQLIFMLEPMKENINKKVGFNFVKAIFLTLDRKSVPSEENQKAELKTAISKILTDKDID